MTPLMFAAALALSPAAPSGQPSDRDFVAPLPRLTAPAPAAACAKFATQAVAPDGVRFFKKLNELPWGVIEHAVWRTVSGCPVREILYEGETWYLASNPPQLESGPATEGRMRRRSSAPAPNAAPEPAGQDKAP